MSVETLGINKRKYSTHTFFFIIQSQDWIFLLLLIFMQVICPVYTQNCKDSVYCNQKLGGDINVFFFKYNTSRCIFEEVFNLLWWWSQQWILWAIRWNLMASASLLS